VVHRKGPLFYLYSKIGRREILIGWDEFGVLKECAVRPPVSLEGFKTAWQRLMTKALEENPDLTRFTFHDLRAKAGSDARDWRMLEHTSRETFERVYNRSPVRIVNGSGK